MDPIKETRGRAGFPEVRGRRLRRTEPLRAMVQETSLRPVDLVYPLFIVEGDNMRREVSSMPGVAQLSIDRMIEEVGTIADLGIPAVLLFGIPDEKDAVGAGAYAPDGIVQRATRELKARYPDILIITDVCLCEYTDHGHCGLLRGTEVDNDASLDLHAQTAISHVEAGADIVAPSNMMDGTVGAIRRALDVSGYGATPIMAYSAKYASGFYGPFRDAAASAPSFGDRRSYQMDPANGREALREVALDVAEGADIVMVKPALAYLDVIARVRASVDLPVAAYNVSGEYAMVKAAAANGWLDECRIVTEILTGIKRAGADIIITYHAKDVARWLREG
ncbi:MAG: porphobilinogen synthase [Chloroflexota bacterium]|nr:porphobilinogen synthase [Chloroflexota bacterium]